ncbi:hypothetical protein BGZ74_007537 [Mortierella antarctica]|nr:hypothetical protein BGZ74_007537 [Mortierella antarctica]
MSAPEILSASVAPETSGPKPKVLIAGAGIGGLTLALLLHKANVPFLVLERATEIKPLGAAFVLGPSVASLLSQLGIYDEFVAMGKPQMKMNILDEDLKLQFANDFSHIKDVAGTGYYSFSRPDLHELLWRHVPRENIHLGKKIVNYDDDSEGVLVRCADGSSYRGHILVGADGAYSAVRQHMFKAIKAKRPLPVSDDVAPPFGCVTEVLDPEDFPRLKSETCDANSVLGVKNMCTWITLTTKANTVCWMVIRFLDKESSKDDQSFRIDEWGPEATEAMCKEVRTFKVPGGKDDKVLTIGDYIDRTPKDLISKVMLEEKVYETWYSGRAVLLGDACHKMNPCGAAGAVTAMHDAAALANWISTLKFPSMTDLDQVFKEYRAERYPVAKEAFETSQMFTKMAGKSLTAVLVRASMKHVPAFLWRRILISMSASRPQVSFLPLVEDKGEVKPLHQPSLHKTLSLAKKQAFDDAFDNAVTVI